LQKQAGGTTKKRAAQDPLGPPKKRTCRKRDSKFHGEKGGVNDRGGGRKPRRRKLCKINRLKRGPS